MECGKLIATFLLKVDFTAYLIDMIDEVILGFCFDIHRSVKTGAWQDSHLTGEEEPPLSIAGHVDVIGLPVSTITGLPCLKTIPQVFLIISTATIFRTTPTLRSIVQTVSEHLQQAGER